MTEKDKRIVYYCERYNMTWQESADLLIQLEVAAAILKMSDPETAS